MTNIPVPCGYMKITFPSQDEFESFCCLKEFSFVSKNIYFCGKRYVEAIKYPIKKSCKKSQKYYDKKKYCLLRYFTFRENILRQRKMLPKIKLNFSVLTKFVSGNFLLPLFRVSFY